MMECVLARSASGCQNVPSKRMDETATRMSEQTSLEGFGDPGLGPAAGEDLVDGLLGRLCGSVEPQSEAGRTVSQDAVEFVNGSGVVRVLAPRRLAGGDGAGRRCEDHHEQRSPADQPDHLR
jgi:hypothetical protein